MNVFPLKSNKATIHNGGHLVLTIAKKRSAISFQNLTFQPRRLPAPNTFQIGDCVAARKMLEQMCHHDLHFKLSQIDRNGYNASRFVVERGDEQMFDILLPFCSQNILSKNPSWMDFPINICMPARIRHPPFKIFG